MGSLLDRELEHWLSRIGLKPGALYKIRFGGVVGKMTLVAMVALGIVGIVAWRAGAQETLLWGCLFAAVLLGAFVIGAVLFFANKYPEHATLEGAHVVALQQLKNQFAVKGVGEIAENQPLIAQRLDTKVLKPPTEGEPT